MAFPQINGSAFSETDSNGTSHNVTLPATVNSGDFLIIYAGTNDTGTFTAPTGWTLKQELSQSQSAGAVFAKVADGTEDGATVIYTFSANTQASNIAIVGDSWGGAVGDIEVSIGQQKADVNPDPDSVTASWGSDDNLFIASAHIRRNDRSVTTYPTNYTANQLEHASGNASGGARMALASRELAAATDDPGTFTISGTTNSISFTTVIKPAAAGGGAFTLTADGGSFALTGQDATLKADRNLSADSGSFALTGQDASIAYGRVLGADSGSFTFTGNDADLRAARSLQADAGSYALTGQDAGLIYTPASGSYSLVAESGSFALSGSDSTLKAGRNLVADTGSYSLTGQTVDLRRGYSLSADSGTFALTGQDAAFLRSYALSAESGSFMLTGLQATLTYTGATSWAVQPDTATTWTEQNENSSTWETQ